MLSLQLLRNNEKKVASSALASEVGAVFHFITPTQIGIRVLGENPALLFIEKGKSLSAYPNTSQQSRKMRRSKKLWDKLLDKQRIIRN